METMEYSKVGIKDIFKGIADFFKQQVEKEKKDIERQIAEIQAEEDSKNIEQLETEVETHEIGKAKKTRNISRKPITKTENIRAAEKVIEKEQDIEL